MKVATVILAAACAACAVRAAAQQKGTTVSESARDIPVAFDVDVVVVGGSTGAVAAAVAAAEEGASVFLAAPRPYLGEDVAGTLRLWLPPGHAPEHPLAKALFTEDEGGRRRAPSPLHVKRTLDDALLGAGVTFLTGCYATDLLTDSEGRPAGIVMANRMGRQAVRAKVVIDATPRGTIARMAGAAFEPTGADPRRFTRVVIGGDVRAGDGIVGSTELPGTFELAGGKDEPGGSARAIEYTLDLEPGDGSFSALAEAEQAARDLTWTPGLVDASETLWQPPVEAVRGRGDGVDALRPAGVDRLWVVASTDASPDALFAPGEAVGRSAAREALEVKKADGVRLAAAEPAPAGAKGEVCETLRGLRPVSDAGATVHAEARGLPVLGEFDVVVVGGGTAGAPAGISSARAGARTLVVEYLYGLGGVSTMGLIGRYYHGYRGGFTAEIDQGVAELGAPSGVLGKIEWYRRELRAAGGTLWFGAMGVGAFVEDGRVTGVVVATPDGRGIVRAGAVIDSTGNADVAAVAGARTEFIGAEHVAVQGAGLPPVALAANYTNTDYMFADDSDVVDAWHLFVYARRKWAGAWDLGQLIDTRERRRIVGDVTITPVDEVLGRTWPDTVVFAKSNFDSHGYTVHPLFLVRPPDREGLEVLVPYRALLPQGLDGIIVTGLAASAQRDALPVIRMQPDLQNQGYAMGRAAAMAARAGGRTREIDLKALQRHLVEKQCLPAQVLTDRDSLPLPPSRIAEAIARGLESHADIAAVLTDTDHSVPLLSEAYEAATDEQRKLTFALVLGVLGDPAGAGTLARAIAEAEWDEGWNYRGMGQFGMSMSRVDSLIVALARTRAPEALEPILAKARALGDDPDFSHCRAVAMACETLADPRAAPVLAELLERPGMTGHATTTVDEATAKAAEGGGTATAPRNRSLRELVLARALYRSGDCSGLARRILETYARDLRGVYARHAKAVLGK